MRNAGVGGEIAIVVGEDAAGRPAEEVKGDFVERLVLTEEALRCGEGAAEKGLETRVVGESVLAAVGRGLGKGPKPAEVFGLGGVVEGDLRGVDLCAECRARRAQKKQRVEHGEMAREAHGGSGVSGVKGLAELLADEVAHLGGGDRGAAAGDVGGASSGGEDGEDSGFNGGCFLLKRGGVA